MAESTLSLEWSDLRSAVGRYLDYGTDPTVWDSQQQADVEAILKAGLRQFYFPATGYEWSFMRQTLTITTVIPTLVTPAQTVSGTIATKALTLSAELADLEVGAALVLDPSGNAEQAEVDTIDGVNVTLVADLEATYAADAFNYTNPPQVDYDLPDNFGSLNGPLTFRNRDNADWPVEVTSESRIRILRQGLAVTTGKPDLVAVNPKPFDTTTGQRFELLVWPEPDGEYQLSGLYNVLGDALTTAAPYPLGGAAYAGAIEASCLAVAERRFADEAGLYNQQFQQDLMGAIQRDKRISTPSHFGYNGDASDGREWSGRLRDNRFKRYLDGVLLNP